MGHLRACTLGSRSASQHLTPNQLPTRSQVLAVMPFLVLLHLANAVWLYGEDQVFDSAIGPPSIQGSDELVSEYEEGVDYAMDQHDLIAPIIERVTRTNTMPVFVLLVLLISYEVLHHTLFRFIMFVVSLTPLKESAVKEQLSEQEFNPPFTEAYERFFPPRWKWRTRELVPTEPPELPAERGWRSELKDGAYCLYKIDSETSGGAGSVAVTAENTARKKTFEVVSENGLCTYQMRENTLYEDVIMARDSLVSSMDVEGGGGAADEEPAIKSPKRSKSKKDGKKVLPVVAGAQ